MEISHEISLQLSLQRAFLGEITEEDEDSMDCVATEVIVDFPEYTIDLQCIAIDMPESLAQHRLSAWVDLRKE